MEKWMTSWRVAIALIAQAAVLQVATSARALDVVTSTTDLAAITEAVGAGRVKATSIAKGYQDPHYVEAKPSYMLKVRKADLLFYVGLQLEIGWLSLLVEGARNSSLVSIPAGTGITILEVPTGEVSRSQGDIHPEGNPHYWLDPRNGLIIAGTISQRLRQAEPEMDSEIAAASRRFKELLRERTATWERKMAPYRGRQIVAYHKQWEYLANWLGLRIVGYIEDKPGVPPSPAHLAALIRQMRRQSIPCVIAATFVDPKIPKLVAGKAGARFVVLPSSVGAVPEATDYIRLFDIITDRLAEALKQEGGE